MKILKSLLIFLLLNSSYISKAQKLRLKIEKDQSLNYHSTFPFQVEFMKDGKLFSTNSTNKKTQIKWSNLKIEVQNGEYLKSLGLIKIDGAKTNKEFGKISIRIENKKTHQKLDTALNLNFSGLELLNFNANDGKSITKWPRLHLMALILGEMTNTEPNRKAGNGKNGNKGKDGLSANVFLNLIKIDDKEILKITCVNDNQDKNKTIYIDPNTGTAQLLAHGGNGSKGRKGEIIMHANGKTEIGTNGKSGRNGLDGHFDVFVTKKMYPYLKRLSFSTTHSHALSVKPILKEGSKPKSKINNDGEVHVFIVD